MTAPRRESAGSEQPSAASEGVAELTAQIFGDRLPLAVRYAAILAGDGVEHGHLGPREVSRLWRRHLLNCAVVTDLLPEGQRVLDVGSGAGLPGLVLAVRRPDLRVVLLEPMQRRSDFLRRCVDELGVADQVTIVRGRADEVEVIRSVAPCEWVTARAVAPLDRLVRWCVPLLSDQGQLLALKGAGAAGEVTEAAREIRRVGFTSTSVRELPIGDDVSRVVMLGGRARPGQPGRRGRK